ncbi:hypothetical protein HBI25_218800 [Parastagonospora nodorum]|nr:hypothetical protein HBH52_225600 [Parastagonospora nodorum]KAH4043580.1 hypothetical protein HBH49_232210 [Parastagonospora nodorum]KAH4089086.1 hypothetical protein HBH46_192950 [Parastagonospora nodorum]KAH4251890.1 hypothetical protein HBI03_218660 [Parastagonospora nodorum]KAH4258796.1 hypothetical protein HBI04_216970 [Parastagonospora nodorum]
MQSDDECSEDHQNKQQSEDFAKPFRLLDLPKEVRLMIYEELDVVYKRHIVPLSLGGGGHYGTLINASLEGVRILQTCRTINEEASYIMKPALTHLSAKPATMIVKPEDLVALTSMGDFNTFHRNLLERLLSGLRNGLVTSAIIAYRTGRAGIAELRRAFRAPKEIDDELLKAIGTFILRIGEFSKNVPESPPVRVVIEMLASFRRPFYTVTFSRLRRTWYKIVRGEALQQSRTVQTTRRRVLNCFAHRTSYSSTSVAVLLHFSSPLDMYYDLPNLQQILENAIVSGIAAARAHRALGTVQYGGLYDPTEL